VAGIEVQCPMIAKFSSAAFGRGWAVLGAPQSFLVIDRGIRYQGQYNTSKVAKIWGYGQLRRTSSRNVEPRLIQHQARSQGVKGSDAPPPTVLKGPLSRRLFER